MLCARPSAMAHDCSQPGSAADKNATVKAFVRHVAFSAYVTCAVFLAASE